MTDSSVSLDALATCLKDWLDHVSVIWNRYQQDGPGRLSAAMISPVDSAAEDIEQLICQLDRPDVQGLDVSGLRTSIRETTKLARRCACTSQGLCFISGEAGLIPRRDQHVAFEKGLELTRLSIERLCNREGAG